MAAVVITKAQREILVKIILFIISILVVSAVSFYLSGVAEEYEKKHTWLKNDVAELGRKLEGLNKKTLEFSDAIKTWENLPEESKTLPGLRINDAKDILEQLQAKYKLSGVKTSFSKPGEILGDYKTDTVTMISSVINMTFNAKSDIYIYGFIIDVINSLPGYVQIKSVSINKPTPITKETLKRVAMGEDVAIISVTMDFYWHDLKYKGPASSQPAIGGAPIQ